jgi:transposase-like protein
MADKLTIGDQASIEARNKGRIEFERQEEERLAKELRGKVECPRCPYDDHDCTGPRIEAIYAENDLVVWECTMLECPCCGADQYVSEFNTTLQGKPK